MKRSMKITMVKLGTLAAGLLSGALLFDAPAANAQTNAAPDATATRPAKAPSGQTSIPSSGPPATTTQTTGEASRDPTIKQMNETEKSKVDSKGK